ncbi:unnamed protein product [Dracunculus medinensis]|uniref:General transcription factor 3C polypeptide 5 n=1 Tax=Dracunculus medinensis TaxID=318479 RepID=A0A0N4U324_DRAME|nr:unnamed protein product [Dracunculus medinensis]
MCESSLNGDFVIVSYPGCVKNVEKALETLGGLQTISSNHISGRPLELRHHLENPYASALISERKKSEKYSLDGQLLAVIKIRRKKSDRNVVESKILGFVYTIYTFSTLFDFQYLPLRKNNPTDKHYEDLVPKIIPPDLSSAINWWDRSDEKLGTPLFLPPFQFSRYNMPSSRLFCKETVFVSERIQSQVKTGGLRNERKALSVTVQATDNFPCAPSEEAVNDANFRCKDEELHRLLQEIFEERPLWTRIAIVRKTGLDEPTLRVLLPKFAFYVSSGAWGRCWCRFGYDPRIDPDAKKYQTIMVTFRLHSKIPERQRLKVACVKLLEWLILKFFLGKLPHVRQMWYSICDIKLPFAEEVLPKIIKDLFDSRKTSEQSYIVNLFILPQEFCLNF